MFDFKAYFYGNDVYINEKYRYSSNEIIIAYLNDRRIKNILDSDFVYELKRYKRCLTISPYMDHDDFSRYNDNVYAAMSENHHYIVKAHSTERGLRFCGQCCESSTLNIFHNEHGFCLLNRKYHVEQISVEFLTAFGINFPSEKNYLKFRIKKA